MQTSLLDSFGRKIGIVAIAGYQKHISPHKGFACAHRLLYGGESCSGYIKRVIAEEGLIAAWDKSQARFQACKQANLVLRASKMQRKLSQMEDSEPTEEADGKIEDDKPLKRSQPRSSRCWGSGYSSGDDCSNCSEIVDCSFLACSSTDDCHLPDCSGVECDFLDCGSCGN